MKRMAFVAGVAAGYVLGTRAGKQRYEQIKDRAQQVWASEPVQQKVEVARQTIAEKAPVGVVPERRRYGEREPAAVQMIALRLGRQREELFRDLETFAALLPFMVRLRWYCSA